MDARHLRSLAIAPAMSCPALAEILAYLLLLYLRSMPSRGASVKPENRTFFYFWHLFLFLACRIANGHHGFGSDEATTGLGATAPRAYPINMTAAVISSALYASHR